MPLVLLSWWGYYERGEESRKSGRFHIVDLPSEIHKFFSSVLEWISL